MLHRMRLTWHDLTYALMAIGGAALLAEGRAGSRLGGVCLFAWGAFGLAGHVMQIWRAAREDLFRRLRDEERTRRREVRRLRSLGRRERRRVAHEALLRSEELGRQRRAEERLAVRRAALLAEEEAASRDQRVEAESARLRAREAADLRHDAAAAFQARGFTVADSDMPDQLLLLAGDGTVEGIACLAPTHREAGVAEVEELEALRRACGARTAFLVSMAGFSAEAVRGARQLPVVLVESYLLAVWLTVRQPADLSDAND